MEINKLHEELLAELAKLEAAEITLAERRRIAKRFRMFLKVVFG